MYLYALVSVCSSGLYAQNLNEQTRRRQEIERQIEVIDKQLASNRTQQQTTTRDLTLLQQKIASRRLLLNNIEGQIKLTNDSIKKKEREIRVLQDEYEKVEFSYLKILYQAYTQRNRQIWATQLLASESLPQAYRRWQYFKNYTQYLNRQAFQIKQANDMVAKEIGTFQKLRTDAEGLKAAQQKELATLNKEEAQFKEKVAEISRQEGRLKTLLQQEQRKLDAVNKEIARILAEAEKERKTGSAKELEMDKALAASFEQNRGRLPWPLANGVITEPYGQHNHPVLKEIQMPFNNGVGITGNRNDEVRAVFQGVVKQIILLPGYNQCILVQHGSYYTFYCKLGSVNVKLGDAVATGDLLGTLSETNGEHTLHFEVWNGTNRQNPEQWLRKR